nr:reverse transcriptase domain-containing protein [Tanacetum cinerariifolium]
MSTRSNSSHLFSSLQDPESLIRRRNLGEPSFLFDFEEVMNNIHNQELPLHNNNGPPPMVRPNGQAPQTMEELCQPSINGRGRPIAPIPIQAKDFGFSHHMIQQVQNTCQFRGLPGDDANRHIDKFLEITQHMKQNGVSDDALRSCSLPSNTVPNPRADLKAITTRSGVTLAGPSVSSPSKELSLPEFTSTQMILELADRSTTRPVGIAEDVLVKTGRALIDVYGKELTLRVDDEAITFNVAITFKVGQTSKYSYNDAESINRIDVIDVACKECVQEVLGFSNNSKSGNPTQISDPIIALSSPYLTPFEGGDFILEEIEACLTSKSIPPGIDDTNFDLEGDIRLIEKLLNDDPSSSPLPPKELNVEEIKTVKSSIDEPPNSSLRNYRLIWNTYF